MPAASTATQKKKGAAPLAPAVHAAKAPVIQPKLDVGPSSDHFEREADSVARQVMSGGDSPVSIPPTITPLSAQRKSAPSKKSKEEEKPKPSKPAKKAQRKAADQPAKTKPKKEEEKKKSKPAKPAQRKAAPSAAGASGGTAPASVESSIARMQSGSASRLDGGTKGFMEGRFGRDFSGVRVHKGTEAQSAASALGAKAFTVGNDVFFGKGQYRPESNSGRELLAHELTHTVQQTGTKGTAIRRRIQRNEEEDERRRAAAQQSAPAQTVFPSSEFPGASVNITNPGEGRRGTITLPVLGLPFVGQTLKGVESDAVKPVAGENRSLPTAGAAANFSLDPVGARESGRAFETWTAYAREELSSGVTTKLTEMINAKPDRASIMQGEEPVYYLTFRGSTASHRSNIFIGTIAELSQDDLILRPQWSPTGSPGASLDADHILELQVGGKDAGENMWLLQADYNRRVGRQLKTNIENDLKKVLRDDGVKSAINDQNEEPNNVTEIKRNWVLNFTGVSRGRFGRATNTYWTKKQVKDGDHLDHLKVMTEPDLVAAGLRLGQNQRPSHARIFPSEAGGKMVSLPINNQGAITTNSRTFLYPGIFIESGTYNLNRPLDSTDPLMNLDVTVFKSRGRGKKKVIEEKRGPIEVLSNPRLGIAGYVSREKIRQVAGTTRFTAMSPLTFSDMQISGDGVLIGTGSIASEKAIFPGLNVPITLYGEDVRMDFALPMDSLNLGPFSITEVGLGLGVNTDGFFVEGYAGFEIASLGTGSIVAEISEAGPVLSGEFHLATDFLNPAMVAVSYNFSDDTLTATGTLGVQSGVVPGVESGQVTVTITRETVDVNGTINLGGPLTGTTVTVGYTQEEGLTIGAEDIPLPFANLPAVQNATMSIGAARNPETGAWSFTGTGTATLAVPGATGEIGIAYADGLVTMTANAEIVRGPASGTLNFTATNGAIDEEGNPVEGEIGNGITVWGQGSVTIQFGNFIQGTAGIEYTSDNRVILSGEIALPPVYEVFPRREYNRDLLRIEPPEFPIWGVSVAGVGVGIFAFVDARVSFNAYVGPGEIRDAAITAEMDLDRPEDATIHGHAQFFVPAYAGLNLDVGGGLRARLAVAYAQGRVGLEGRLGIEADASASVDIDWNRNDGLAIETDFEANARPKFEMLANASVTVGVDLLVTDVSHTFGPWERSLGEFGPDMTLGVDFPVRWSEADGLDLSLDNITVREPSLDASGLMGDVFDRLAG